MIMGFIFSIAFFPPLNTVVLELMRTISLVNIRLLVLIRLK